MRVLWMTALQDKSLEVPLGPLARRIDDPDAGPRNKAAVLIAAPADPNGYRRDILGIDPAVLRLLRLEKRNKHEPAYAILRAISGKDFGDRDYVRWEAWLRRAR